MDFEARIHTVSQTLIPQQANAGYPPMVVYYFRHLPVIMPADGSMPTTRPPVNSFLLDAEKRLGAWADFLVITSNGVHAFLHEIEQASGRKVLSMVDVTLDEVRRRQLRRVGIVDFRASRMGVYNERLSQLGVPWEAVPTDLLTPLMRAVIAVDEGRTGAEVGQAARNALIYLRSKGVDGIILACTEIPFMLLDAAHDADLINPAQFLAEATVRHALQ